MGKSNFRPTYLYIKTNIVTGLKYFGKTVNNPFMYTGSGTLWLKHLHSHGYEIYTEILGFFTNYEECKKVASQFSRENDIVNSTAWANLMEETLDGGFIPGSITPEARRKAVATARKNGTINGWRKVAASIAARKGTLFTMGMLGKTHSPEARKRLSEASSGSGNSQFGKRKFFNPSNFDESVRVYPENKPSGWITLDEKIKIEHEQLRATLKQNHSSFGKNWYNNGEENMLLSPEAAEKLSNLSKGRMKKRKIENIDP